MKKQKSIMFFVGIQIVLIFLQIHQHSTFINQSFTKQKNEKLKSELEQYKQNATHELALARDYLTIQQFAQTTLSMQPVALHQIKKLKVHNNNATQHIYKNINLTHKNHTAGNNTTHTSNTRIVTTIMASAPEIETLSLLLPLPNNNEHITLACNGALSFNQTQIYDFNNKLNHINHGDTCDQPV